MLNTELHWPKSYSESFGNNLDDEFLESSQGFAPKTRIHFQVGNFTVKTADRLAELQSAMKLRYSVFRSEFGIPETADQCDMDRYDLHSDHLLILDNLTNLTIGTYRLSASNFANQYYSETEFDLTEVLKLPGNKLEVGRACVHPNYRNGAIINLLWRGLITYAKLHDVRYLFGCSSIRTIEPRLAAILLRGLEDRGFATQLHQVNPKPNYLIPNFDWHYQTTQYRALHLDRDMWDFWVPPLLKSYFKAGARVLGQPVLDLNFYCIDFFTLLDLNCVSPQFERKFESWCAPSTT